MIHAHRRERVMQAICCGTATSFVRRRIEIGCGRTAECSIYRGMRSGANLADIEEEVLDDDFEDEDDLDKGQRSRKRRRRAKREESSVSEAISSNITRILEGLLKDYDKTERPGFKTGKSDEEF